MAINDRGSVPARVMRRCGSARSCKGNEDRAAVDWSRQPCAKSSQPAQLSADRRVMQPRANTDWRGAMPGQRQLGPRAHTSCRYQALAALTKWLPPLAFRVRLGQRTASVSGRRRGFKPTCCVMCAQTRLRYETASVRKSRGRSRPVEPSTGSTHSLPHLVAVSD
jgi:hypothetical protein